jgi:hypothetical protein
LSRYNLNARTDGNLEVVVGWDASLSTFFAHVLYPGREYDPTLNVDEEEFEDKFVLMVGNRLGEISSVDELAKILSPYTDIPYNVRKQLNIDSVQPYQRSAFQTWMIEKGLIY